MVELVTKFEHHALGGFLADAGNSRQRTDVVALDRSNHRVRRHAAQDRDRQPGPNAADADQLLKELLLLAAQKAKKRKRIFAHMCVDKQRHFCSQRGQSRKGGNADVDFVSDARGLNDGLVGMFGDQLPAKMSNHALFLSPRSKRPSSILLIAVSSVPPVCVSLPRVLQFKGSNRFCRCDYAPTPAASVWVREPSGFTV